MEINPFHNGHLYFLKEAKKIAKNKPLVCVISTNVVQRGQFSILNKEVKTRLLLENGVDIVCELPTVLANQGGEFFAYNAIKILSQFKVNHLIFGSESQDLRLLQTCSRVEPSTDFQNGIHKTLNDLKSNDILAISYIKAVCKIGLDIDFHLIKRVHNNYNDTSISNPIASATAIRNGLTNNHNISHLLPTFSHENLLEINEELLFDIFKVNLLNCIDNKVDIYLSEDGQLLSRMARILNTQPFISLNDFLESCKDRNNSKYKYARIMLNTVLLVETSDYNNCTYVRILGFNSKFSKLLPKSNFTSLSNPRNEIERIEIRSAKLFSLLTADYQYNEFDKRPIIYNEYEM